MRFFFNFFDKVKNRTNSVFPFEYNKVIEFNNEFSELLKKDAFLARSEYYHAGTTPVGIHSGTNKRISKCVSHRTNQ